MIIYIVEDTLHIVYKEKLITTVLKNCIQKGYIFDKEIFIQEFNKIIKKEKIKSKLFGDNITIVNNGYFKVSDLFFLESIFNDLGFIKIEFLNITELLPVMDAIFVEVNNNYLVIYLSDVLYLDMKYFKDIPKIINILSSFFNKNIAFFGLNKCVPSIKVNGVNTYYLENYDKYITQSLLKVKKWGVLLLFFIAIILFLYYNYLW